jgi:hypothetical protein
MSSCWISYEHWEQKGESTNHNGNDLDVIKKESDGEDGKAVVWYNHKVVGSTPSQVNF